MDKSNARIGMGLVGPGFVASHHLDAVRRLGFVDVVAIAGSSLESAERQAAQLGVQKAYGSYTDLLADPQVKVVHNTTPNYLHYEITMAAIQAGKHVISDKPLAVSTNECRRLRDAAQAACVVNAVTFNYRGSALVQQARLMIEHDEIGPLCFIHGHYLQDWMTDPAVYSWRSDPMKGGPSSALADIGSHWCDLAQHVSGAKVVSVLADMTTVVQTRYRAAETANAFQQSKHGELQSVTVRGEDLASVLVRFDNGALGSFSVGQVLPGYKNSFQLALSGRRGSLRWEQEKENELWWGRHDAPNMLFGTDPALLLEGARAYARHPAGHQEGWADAFRNVIGDIYQWIANEANPNHRPATVSTFADATQVSSVTEAILRSYEAGGQWEGVQVL